MLDVPAYLARIRYTGPTTPTYETLRALHYAHLLAVPFENLDIALGRKIVLDEDAILRKIIHQRRGGFCYELNGAFAALLKALGFQTTLLSARVARDTGGESPEFDHLALRVDLEQPWLVDVGFGESFLEPLRLETERNQIDPAGTFRLMQTGERLQLEKLGRNGTWKPQYSFALTPRSLRRLRRHVPLSSNLARIPLHPKPHLLASHSRRPHHAFRNEVDRDPQRPPRRERINF